MEIYSTEIPRYEYFTATPSQLFILINAPSAQLLGQAPATSCKTCQPFVPLHFDLSRQSDLVLRDRVWNASDRCTHEGPGGGGGGGGEGEERKYIHTMTLS